LKIKLTTIAKINLEDIRDFISKDKPQTAIKFLKELKQKINQIKDKPLQCRKSYYADDENIRDLIFGGYTIVFRINNESLEILRVFNQNKPDDIQESQG